MSLTEFDLPHVPSRTINLFGNGGSSHKAAAGLASRQVPTPENPNLHRSGIEIGL
jgi:hypothetical protein